MKRIAIILSLSVATFSHASKSSTELIEVFLTDAANQPPWHIEEKRKRLDKGLSILIAGRVLRRSHLFRANTAALKSRIRIEQGKAEPNMSLSMRLFEGDSVSNILIKQIITVDGRTIMRGVIKGVPGSKIRLVEYNNALSGTVSYAKNNKLVVLLSDEDRVSIAYEIDVSGVR